MATADSPQSSISLTVGQTKHQAIAQPEPVKQDQPFELERAMSYREAGCYKEAVHVLHQWLATNSRDASAYALLAQVLSLDKQDKPAWVALNTALSINPTLPIVQRNHARLLLNATMPEEALNAAQAAYHGDESDPENQLVLAAALRACERREQALQLVESVLRSRPNYAEAFATRALLKLQCSDLVGALRDAERALAIKPHLAQLWSMVGSLCYQLEDLHGAIDALEKALDHEPDNVGNLVNLGELKRRVGAAEAAIVLLEKAAAIAPNNAGSWVNLGAAFQQAQRIHEAKDAYAKSLAIEPGQAEVASNLGVLAKEATNWEEALRYFDQALVARSDVAEVHSNQGAILKELGRLNDAEASLRRALTLKPDFAEANYNLGNLLIVLARLDGAIASYRRSLAIRPDYAKAYSNLLVCLNYDSHLSAAAVFGEHHLWGKKQTGTSVRFAPPAGDRNPQRRLRVGYVSPDLRRHSVAYFLEPLLREHDHRVIETFCYAEVARPDEVTARLKGCADNWLGTVGMLDEALGQRIVDDKIDILVDLAGHTADNRLLVFARRPAPVQLTWLGYPHSTGLSTMDYRFVDAITDPPGDADAWANETLVRLDNGFLCYAPPAEAPLTAPLPSLTCSSITFGSFNNPAKISPSTLDAWANLLDRVPGSRLLLKGKCFSSTGGSKTFIAQLKQRGVDPRRVTLLGSVPSLADHLALYAQVDIGLDTFPYNGTATTCEAMWMGVPVVTLRGDRHAGRVGASLLTQIGMEEWIASSVRDYVDIAAALTKDAPRLRELRRSLRARVAASPLCAAPAFARKMEASYRDLWRRYCASNDSMPAKGRLTNSRPGESAAANLKAQTVAEDAPAIGAATGGNASGQPSSGRRLHIGGRLHVPGWEVLDVTSAPYVDHLRDATDLSIFPDNTFAEIYASHIVEHFDFARQLEATLKEWCRVIRPGGVIRVSVPDLDVLAELFLDRQSLSVRERFTVMRMIFGGHIDEHDYHVVGLNEEFLTIFLGQAGFTRISRVKEFGLFHDSSELLFRGVSISLNMIAHKPHVID